MKKKITGLANVEDFVDELMDSGEFIISIIEEEEGEYVVDWSKHKTYTTDEGDDVFDEIWVTKKGDLKLVQDMDHAECMTALRLLLKLERLDLEEAEKDEPVITGVINQDEDDFFNLDEGVPRVLH